MSSGPDPFGEDLTGSQADSAAAVVATQESDEESPPPTPSRGSQGLQDKEEFWDPNWIDISQATSKAGLPTWQSLTYSPSESEPFLKKKLDAKQRRWSKYCDRLNQPAGDGDQAATTKPAQPQSWTASVTPTTKVCSISVLLELLYFL